MISPRVVRVEDTCGLTTWEEVGIRDGNDMKRVLFISSQPLFQWRGSPIRVAFDVQALAELGFEVDLLTLPVGEDREIPGVNVVRAPNLFLVRHVPIGPSLVKLGFDVVLCFMALFRVLRRRYAVVHAVEDAGPVGVAAAALGRAGLVYEKHSDPLSYRGGRLRNLLMSCYARVERFTVRRADAVIGTGEGLVDQARAMGGRAAVHHIFDIPSSLVQCDEAAVSAVRARLTQHPDELLVTFVGSFAVYQGVDLMLASIPHVVRECPFARFVVIGGRPDQIEQRRAALAARGAAERVVFQGMVEPDKLPAFLAASDILLSPRLAGVNTPLKILDYFKAGKAIVATDTNANRLILDESTAVFAAPDPEAFAQGICRLLRDSGLRTALGRKGRRLYENEYNFAAFKRRLRRCYDELNGENSAATCRA